MTETCAVSNGMEQIPVFDDFFELEDYFLGPDEDVEIKVEAPTFAEKEKTILKMRLDKKSLWFQLKYFQIRNTYLGDTVALNKLCELHNRAQFSICPLQLLDCCKYIIKKGCTCNKQSHKCSEILDCQEYPREVWEYTFKLVHWTLPKECVSLKRLKEYFTPKSIFTSNAYLKSLKSKNQGIADSSIQLGSQNNKQGLYLFPFYQPYISIAGAEATKIVNELFTECSTREKRNIRMLIANLLLQGSTYIMRRNIWYAQNICSEWHSFRYSIKAQNSLFKKGFIKIQKGYRAKGYAKGIPSVLHPTDKFYELFGQIPPDNIFLDTEEIPDIVVKHMLNKNVVISTESYKLSEKEVITNKNKYKFNTSYIFKRDSSLLPTALRNHLKQKILNMGILNRRYFSQIRIDYAGPKKY